MDNTQVRMTNLFLQLGLDSSAEAIAEFIRTHQLPADVRITEAPFWSESQRQFLQEKPEEDARWAIVVDRLNESLNEDALQAQSARQRRAATGPARNGLEQLLRGDAADDIAAAARRRRVEDVAAHLADHMHLAGLAVELQGQHLVTVHQLHGRHLGAHPGHALGLFRAEVEGEAQ